MSCLQRKLRCLYTCPTETTNKHPRVSRQSAASQASTNENILEVGFCCNSADYPKTHTRRTQNKQKTTPTNQPTTKKTKKSPPPPPKQPKIPQKLTKKPQPTKTNKLIKKSTKHQNPTHHATNIFTNQRQCPCSTEAPEVYSLHKSPQCSVL